MSVPYLLPRLHVFSGSRSAYFNGSPGGIVNNKSRGPSPVAASRVRIHYPPDNDDGEEVDEPATAAAQKGPRNATAAGSRKRPLRLSSKQSSADELEGTAAVPAVVSIDLPQGEGPSGETEQPRLSSRARRRRLPSALQDTDAAGDVVASGLVNIKQVRVGSKHTGGTRRGGEVVSVWGRPEEGLVGRLDVHTMRGPMHAWDTYADHATMRRRDIPLL